MKHLAPTLTILLTLHNKPTIADTLASITTQTRTDFACIVLDSGQWATHDTPDAATVRATHHHYRDHPLIDWRFTGEPADLPARACPVAWATNHAIRAGWVRGTYMATMYDDDRYAPDYAATMLGHLEQHPDVDAAWCTEDRAILHPDGTETITGRIDATHPRDGATFDCHIDGAQVMWRTALLPRIGDPWLPEDPAVSSCRHSDGIFLDRLGQLTTVHPVTAPDGHALVTHRFTRWSTYTPA